MMELCYLTASEALARFKAGTLTPRALLEALIARAHAVNPTIKAFTDSYFEEARAKAEIADARWRDGTARPLEGITVAVKDAQRVAGKRTSYGSLALMANVDRRSDPMIERLEAAGAIIHARTATPEFCLSGMCWSRAWGITRNPFNPDYTPGGSSGGSSAALAAGMTTLATGTDIGGSIRIPAGTCAIVGFKPPHGRNPDGPPSNFDLYNHCGPMTRSVADAALVQNIVSGAHPRDHWSLREKMTIPAAHAPATGMRIAWSMDLGFMAVDPEVRANTLAALETFRSLGCVVEEVAVPWTKAIEAAAVHWYNSMHYGRQTIWHADKHPELLTPYALAYARFAAKHTGLDDMARSWDVVQEMYEFFGPLMARYDAFICPTNAVPAVKAEHDPTDPEFYVNGKKVDPENGWIMTYPFNMLHECPVMSVPSGRSPTTGVPTGIQIVGRTFDDLTVFRLAAAYEAAAPDRFVSAANHPF